MRIEASNVDRLKPEAQKILLVQILESLVAYVEDDRLTEEAVQELLEEILEDLDENFQDDEFGTEGWRHSLLGED
jgi:hypothetical protein